MLVKVAIDLALDRLFTYEVPEALEKKLAVGQLLSVPFGHREARGFAVEVSPALAGGDPLAALAASAAGGLTAQPPARPSRLSGRSSQKPYRLKPITAIVDETPFFSPKLLELVKRVAAYTAAPLESVLKTALPAAVLKKNARPREQLFVEAREFSRSGRREGLAGGCAVKGFAGGCAVSPPAAEAAAASTLTPRQRWLYDNLVRLGGGWLTSLCRELKTTPAALRRLEALGLVTVAVRAKRRSPLGNRRILPSKPWPLNAEQQAALEMIESVASATGGLTAQPFAALAASAARGLTAQPPARPAAQPPAKPAVPVLLFGVTGSGKTEVYLQAIARELDAGRGAIVMVPEISLTPQTVQRFASRFGDRVAVLHSALSDGERYDEWHRIRAGAARVVVGPRSAVWAPVKDLGLIVVDEEHETSYKQDETPRYHARDVAVLRGALEGARVVLGSATPSLESWLNVQRGKYRLATMKGRAGAGTLPTVRLVEMRDGSIFSSELLDAIRVRLDRHEQTILFLNRRGYSRQVVCEACGHVIECPDCGLPYTYHQADDCLRCHVCGGWVARPATCPACHASALEYRGIGTQRAEAALKKCFARAKILRMDADSTSRKHTHDDILDAFRRQEADVLLGTQMIAKGLDFPNVTLVGVLNADSSINMPDFRAVERSFQLFAQVAGRAGRAELPGEVFIQSHEIDSPVLRAVVRGDFAAFAADELKAREEGFFPPYCHLAMVNFRSKDLKLVGDWATMYAASLAKCPGLNVTDAMPSALEKAEGWYRWQVMVRAASASAIVKAWRWISSARPAPAALRIALDVDAYSLV